MTTIHAVQHSPRGNGLARERNCMVSSLWCDRFSVSFVGIVVPALPVPVHASAVKTKRTKNQKKKTHKHTHKIVDGSPCAPRWPRNCGSPCGAARGKDQPRRRAIPTPRCRATVAARVPRGGERDIVPPATKRPPTYQASRYHG